MTFHLFYIGKIGNSHGIFEFDNDFLHGRAERPIANSFQVLYETLGI